MYLGTKIQKRSEFKQVFTFFYFDTCEKVRFGICNYQKRTFSKSFKSISYYFSYALYFFAALTFSRACLRSAD